MQRWFGLFVRASLICTFLVILAGAIVRTTGSGMGCPDWPKCFGQYIPPTDISQLPSDYKTIYAVQGKEIADFDTFKTWTEYINRLLGALLGLFVLGALVTSFAYWGRNKSIALLSFIVVFLVGFEAWLGSVVVATDLKPVTITTHMLVAFAIVTLLSFNVVYERKLAGFKRLPIKVPTKIKTLFLVTIALFVVQVVLGTQVREQIDQIAKAAGGYNRDKWVGLLDAMFYIHRSYSIVWGILMAYLFTHIFKYFRQSVHVYRPVLVAGVFTGLSMLTGVIMAYFAVPAAVQPMHLIFSAIIYGSLSYGYISLVVENKGGASLAAKS